MDTVINSVLEKRVICACHQQLIPLVVPVISEAETGPPGQSASDNHLGLII